MSLGRHGHGRGIVLCRISIEGRGMVCLVWWMRLVLRSLWCHLGWRDMCRLERVSAILWNGNRGSTGSWRIVACVWWRCMAVCNCWLRRHSREVACVSHADVSLTIDRTSRLHHGWAADWFNEWGSSRRCWFRGRRFLQGETVCQCRLSREITDKVGLNQVRRVGEGIGTKRVQQSKVLMPSSLIGQEIRTITSSRYCP
jgi:hypothetical protein